MTQKDCNEIIRQLRNARQVYERKFGPDLEVNDRIQARVMAYVQAQGIRQSAPKLTFSERFGLAFRFARHVVPPRFAYAAVIFAFFAGVTSAAVNSRNALPGEALYPAKLAIDGAKVRFTSNPASRAQVQMEIAGHRLREIQEISQTGDEYNGRLNEALSRFAKDVGEAQRNLAQAGDPAQVKAATTQIAKKAQQYSQELTATRALLEQKAAISQPDTLDTADPDNAEDPEVVDGLDGSDTALSQKPVRIVEFSAFEQAEQALQAVSQEEIIEPNAEVKIVEESAEVDESPVEELKDGEVGL